MSSEPPYPEAPATLHLDGWAGRSKQPVTVVGETPKRYRIRADKEAVRLAGRARWLEIGATALVPKKAVTFVRVSDPTGSCVRSEHPYPEAPLASRKAPLSERDRPNACAEREAAEPLASTGKGVPARNSSEVMPSSRSENRADPKPPRRYIDPEVLRAFHDAQPDCLTCGYYRVSAHHLVSRAQRGGDVAENLIPLCGACHGALHDGNTYHAYGVSHTPDSVRFRIGRFLTSEAGEDHLNYVKAKLGTRAGAFLARYGVEL